MTNVFEFLKAQLEEMARAQKPTMQQCRKCGGSGRHYGPRGSVGTCYACKGNTTAPISAPTGNSLTLVVTAVETTDGVDAVCTLKFRHK